MAKDEIDWEAIRQNLAEKSKKWAVKTGRLAKLYFGKATKATRDAAMLARPLTRRETFELGKVKQYLSGEEYNKVAGLLKQGKLKIRLKRFSWSFLVSAKNILPWMTSDENFVEQLNGKIKSAFLQECFEDFKERAWNVIPQYIAPNILGLQDIKQAAALQLFSKEQIHSLVIGNLDTRKEEILKSAKELASQASFTYGHGSEEQGLIFTFRNKKILPGILPKMHKGLVCIDRLNTISAEDESQLGKILERGYASIKTKDESTRFDAEISLLAAANPKDSYFESYEPEQIKAQMPFDSYLLSRMHLIFIAKKANLNRFADIAEKVIMEEKAKINRSDIAFIKRYMQKANSIPVELPVHLVEKIKEFAVGLKEKEKNLPYEVTPKMVEGVLRLAKASARMEMRKQVEVKDMARVFELYDKATTL